MIGRPTLGRLLMDARFRSLSKSLEFPIVCIRSISPRGDQLSGDVLRTSLNNKIPAIVDAEAGTTFVESGAILTYLADKTRRLIPSDEAKRYRVLEWLWWQGVGIGPVFGQTHAFRKFDQERRPLQRSDLPPRPAGSIAQRPAVQRAIKFRDNSNRTRYWSRLNQAFRRKISFAGCPPLCRESPCP